MDRDNNKTLNILSNGNRTVPISLVNRALEELTTRASAGAQKQRKSNLNRLCKSVLNKDGKSNTLIHSMLGTGISAKEIFEVFIPDAARQLGDCWVKNTLSFAEVTLATSKLQTIAREFERLYIGSISSGASGPEIMVISPKGDQHTFGSQMISRQFRRLGASPYLSINNNLQEIKKIISSHKFKLIGLSLSDYRVCSQESEIRFLIELIKKFKIPIIAGGSLIHSHKDLVKSLNVDLIANDAVKVLRYFNLRLPKSKNLSDLVTT